MIVRPGHLRHWYKGRRYSCAGNPTPATGMDWTRVAFKGPQVLGLSVGRGVERQFQQWQLQQQQC